MNTPKQVKIESFGSSAKAFVDGTEIPGNIESYSATEMSGKFQKVRVTIEYAPEELSIVSRPEVNKHICYHIGWDKERAEKASALILSEIANRGKDRSSSK